MTKYFFIILKIINFQLIILLKTPWKVKIDSTKYLAKLKKCESKDNTVDK
jgi:hypothetical protein